MCFIEPAYETEFHRQAIEVVVVRLRVLFSDNPNKREELLQAVECLPVVAVNTPNGRCHVLRLNQCYRIASRCCLGRCNIEWQRCID